MDDKSGQGRHVVASGTARPTVAENALNGLPVLLFDGSNDVLSVVDADIAVGAFVVVFRRDNGLIVGMATGPSAASDYVGRPSGDPNNLYVRYAGVQRYNTASLYPADFIVLSFRSFGTGWTVRINGAASAALSGSTAHTAQVYDRFFIGSRRELNSFFNHRFCEFVGLASATADDMDLLDGYAAHKWGLAGNLPAEHPYKSAAPTVGDDTLSVWLDQPYHVGALPLSVWLDQRYGLAVALSGHLEQPYSFLLQAWLAQHYGDVRQLRAHLIQRYGNVPVLRAWLEQLYEDGRPLATWLEQPWQMSAPLIAHLAQRYGIAAGKLETFVAQLYTLHEHPQLAAILLQPYLIGDLERTTHEFDYEVSIDGVPVSPHVVNWDFRRSRYYGTIELGIKEQAEALLAVPGAELAFLFGGTDYHFLVEDGWEETSGWSALSYRVAAHSRTKRLGAPHAAPITGTVGPGLASEVFAALVAPYGITLSYQIADCYLAPIEAEDETPIDLIRRILPEQAVLQSGPAGDVLYVQWDVEVPVPRWFTAPPAATIDDLTGFVQTSETSDPQPGYNRYEIVDQQTAQDNSQLVSEQIDGRTMECRQYLSPWDDALAFELRHTAGSHVSIEPFGIVTRTETETVEIVDGAGRTRYPIDAVLSTAWR
ncbi:MAG: hypothetical protein RBS34_16240, partial [Desulfofustis sp.]|nr:hypothetical protein [Desulfofustis sp.]